MESLTQPQFIAFFFTVAVPIIILVWNQVQTNKKLIDAVDRQEERLQCFQDAIDSIKEMVRGQERKQEFLQVTLDKIEKHIERSEREHAVLMDRTSPKDM